MPGQVTVNLTPNGFMTPDTPIIVKSSESLDPKSAQGAITIEGQQSHVVLSDDGHTAEVRTDGLVSGLHRLRVGELLSADGERVGDPFEFTFMVVDTPRELLEGLRLDHVSRIRVDEFGTTRLPIDRRPDGPFIELVKATAHDGGEPVELAFDEQGRRMEAGEILAEPARRRAERFGRVHETLHGRLEQAEPGERIPVAIWARLPEDAERPDKPADRPAHEPPPEERRLDGIVARTAGRLREIVAREFGDERATADEHAPVVYANVPADQIGGLAVNDMVAAVFLYDPEGVDDLGNSMAVAHSDTVQNVAGFTGRAINVAVWENGPDDVTNLQITARYVNNPATSAHARLTHAIVKNVEPNHPHGHAPDCNLHSANTKGLDALRWAVRDRGCTVVSQSFHRSNEPGSSVPSLDDFYKDWLVLHWPYPTIVQAAGNFWNGDSDNIQPPSSEFVNHKGFNSLAIGNHDDTAAAMDGGSVFRNPASSHGDRELPEIAANGTGVFAVNTSGTGTSFAAPAVAGCTALIQQVDGVLRSWPEGCRAILLASANRNPSGGSWGSDLTAHVDAADGSGALDGLAAVHIAQSRRHRDDPGTRRGWDVGTLRTADFDGNRMSTFVYRVTVPPKLLLPTVKVALAWDSEVYLNVPIFGQILTSALKVDFDLLVTDTNGNLVGSSSSYDNSYEIAEFAAAPGHSYDIRIRRWSGTNDTWYGIAWTVSGIQLWPPLELNGLSA